MVDKLGMVAKPELQLVTSSGGQVAPKDALGRYAHMYMVTSSMSMYSFGCFQRAVGCYSGSLDVMIFLRSLLRSMPPMRDSSELYIHMYYVHTAGQLSRVQ